MTPHRAWCKRNHNQPQWDWRRIYTLVHEATVNTTNQNQIDCKKIMHIVDDAGGITTNQIQGDWMQIYIVQDTAEKQATKGQQEVIQTRCPALFQWWTTSRTLSILETMLDPIKYLQCWIPLFCSVEGHGFTSPVSAGVCGWGYREQRNILHQLFTAINKTREELNIKIVLTGEQYIGKWKPCRRAVVMLLWGIKRSVKYSADNKNTRRLWKGLAHKISRPML